MENEKKTSEEQKEKAESKKKKDAAKIGDILKDVGKTIVDAGKKVTQLTIEELDKIQDGIDFKKQFQKETKEFKIEGTERCFRGFKKPKDNVIYFRVQDEKICSCIKTNSILISTKDQSKFQVITMETKKVENGSMVVKGERIPLSLLSIHIEPYEEKEEASKVHVTETMHIASEKVEEDPKVEIKQKLMDFEHRLTTTKPGFFHKSHYKEAVQLYPAVKEAILKGEKDAEIVKRFLALLHKIGKGLSIQFEAIR